MVHYPGRPVDAVGLVARTRIGPQRAAVDAEEVVGSRTSPVDLRLPPAPPAPGVGLQNAGTAPICPRDRHPFHRYAVGGALRHHNLHLVGYGSPDSEDVHPVNRAPAAERRDKAGSRGAWVTSTR